MVIVTGDADQKDGEYSGPVLAQAAALLKSCRPGQVLAASATKEVVGDSLPTGISWRRVNSGVEAFELIQKADL